MRFMAGWLASLALVLTACGGDPAPSTPNPNAVYPRFDPTAGDLPFNNDLVFAGSTDGTAHVGAPSDPVRAALNQLDGFSTSGYFDVMLSGSVAPATAQAGQSVRLIELETGTADPLPMTSVTGVRGVASFDVQVVSLDGASGNAVRLRPTQPLKPRTKYLVALTDDLRDLAGARMGRSASYQAVRNSATAIAPALLPVRQAVQAWEALAAGVIAAGSGGTLSPAQAQEKLLLTYTFTTTDTLGPLRAMGSPRGTIAQRQIDAGELQATAVNNAQSLEASNLLPSPKARPLGINELTGIDFNLFSASLAANVGKLYTGFLELPYYLTAADAPGLAFGEFLARPWKPDEILAGALVSPVPADADGSRNVTWRYPFARRTGNELVPLQLTLPQNNWVPGYAGAANCGQIYTATGYPTVIYVHGITSDRTSVVALAHTLASRCIATVAIDLPLHGVPANSAFVSTLNTQRSGSIPFAALYGANVPRERHFEVAGAPGAPAPMNFVTPGTNDGSGAQFINLPYLTVTRDHSRQAVMDLLNLNASLGSLNTAVQGFASAPPGLDLNRIYVVGVSLGGILSSVFTTVNQSAIVNDTVFGLPSPLPPIRGLVASVAGSQVSQILARSATFAPVINNGLSTFGVLPGTSHYERFFYTAQAAVDSADPVNFMGTLATQGVPVLVQQVNGDLVVPNGAPEAPLAGTSALARLLGATRLGVGATALGRGYVRHTAGGHVSLLRPEGGAPQVTAEMQTQVVTFVLNSGTVSVGGAAPGNIEPP
ncbi:MAG: hypothetical protein KAF64_02545 [Hydrogenophaga sp.]|uniref:hypothetical protein n=1 Tax=Hydrogenophaga sp. TaxID=1904254 RepID=UPI0025C20DB6|nr:hypothetical protein [Hydrogenophaga sp.]MBU7572208.1 hypothetical protein [Hydrogenophaga sp.]